MPTIRRSPPSPKTKSGGSSSEPKEHQHPDPVFDLPRLMIGDEIIDHDKRDDAIAKVKAENAAKVAEGKKIYEERHRKTKEAERLADERVARESEAASNPTVGRAPR